MRISARHSVYATDLADFRDHLERAAVSRVEQVDALQQADVDHVAVASSIEVQRP